MMGLSGLRTVSNGGRTDGWTHPLKRNGTNATVHRNETMKIPLGGPPAIFELHLHLQVQLFPMIPCPFGLLITCRGQFAIGIITIALILRLPKIAIVFLPPFCIILSLLQRSRENYDIIDIPLKVPGTSTGNIVTHDLPYVQLVQSVKTVAIVTQSTTSYTYCSSYSKQSTK